MKCLIRGLVPKLHWRWHRHKKPKISLQGLPLDILIMVMLSLDNISDLFSLIQTSTTFKRLFDRYRKSILLGVCKNMVGSNEATWKAASTVLVYQRPVNAQSRSYLPDFAAMRFVLEERDVQQLIDNLHLYASTATKLSGYLDTHCGEGSITADCSFKSGDTLPKQVFFENWLLEFQLRYDPVLTFAKRKQYTKEQLSDAALVRISMFSGDYAYSPLAGPLWERKTFEDDSEARNRISTHTSNCYQCFSYNKLLWLKILYHYDYLIWKDENNTTSVTQYNTLMNQICNDMALKGVEHIVEKYELNCGWDREE